MTKNVMAVSYTHLSQDCFVIKPCMIFRGGALDKLTIKEQNHVVDHLKIKDILDFRDKAEACLAPDRQHENILYERISALKMQSHDQYGFEDVYKRQIFKRMKINIKIVVVLLVE